MPNIFKMAISLSYFPILSGLLLLLAPITQAGTVTYDFNIGWVLANPDGQFERTTIGINGHWPLPVMRATVGDQVIVNVNNQLGNQTTTLHFHGLFMNGTTDMDGPAQVTQCGIPPGSQFTYNFTVSRHPNKEGEIQLTFFRSISLALTGTIRMTRASIQTALELLLSSATQTFHIKTRSMKSSYCHSPIGITTKCRC